MHSIKRRRSRLEDPLMITVNDMQNNETALLPTNSLLQQPLVLGPVVDHNKQLITETSELHVMNNSSIIATDPNGESNTFIVLPQQQNGVDDTQTILQSIPVYLLIPKQESDKVLHTMSNIKLLTEPEGSPKIKELDAPIIIKDVRTIKSEEEENAKYPESIDITDDGDNTNLFIINDDVNSVSEDKEDNLRYKTMFKCDFPGCSETFLYSHDRKLHRDVHIFPSGCEYKCGICNMTFTLAIDRNKHVESHSVPSTYKCQVCQTSFPYYTTLIQHLIEKCSTTFRCRYCNIMFASKEDVTLHERTLHLSYHKYGGAKLRIIKRKFNTVKQVTPKCSDNIIVLD